MHFFRIFLVIVNAIGWNSLTKICLETIHTHINQCFEFLLIPFLCLRVGKVDDCHARLPHVPLPYRTVRTLRKYPPSMPSSNITDSCAIYGLIHTQIFNPFAFIRESIPSGSGNTRSSHRKSVQWKSFIQKQSKWNTLSGIPRSSIPSIKLITVFSS